MDPIFIATESGKVFTEHRTTDGGASTICGLRYVDFPMTTTDHPEDGKDWFYDHDRSDVVPCPGCDVTVVSWIGNYSGTA